MKKVPHLAINRPLAKQYVVSEGIEEIIPSKMEVSTAMMSYDFKMSSDYNHDVLKL